MEQIEQPKETKRVQSLDYLEAMKREGLTGYIETRGNVVKFWRENGRATFFRSVSAFSPADMHFFKEVKAQATKKGARPELDKRDIPYFAFNDPRIFAEGPIKNAVEIDINNAYFRAANLLGYIDDELYKKGLEADKLIRLAALGVFATGTFFYKFEGQRIKLISAKKNTLENIFFDISKKVTSDTREALFEAGEKGAIFTWVDAVFITGHSGAREAVQKSLISKGYEVKTREIELIKLSQDRRTIEVFEAGINYKAEEPRRFTISARARQEVLKIFNS